MRQLPLSSIFPFRFFNWGLFIDYDKGAELISSDVLVHTENAVFTADGRYFVAAEHSDPNLGWGIYEVLQTATGYGVKQVAAGILEVGSTSHRCWFDGLTTDGKYLYATAAVHPKDDFTKTDYGALFRILPREDTADVSIVHYNQNQLHNYNGMAVGSNGCIYMSNHNALYDGSGVSVYQVAVTDQDNFKVQITPWLLANPLRDQFPNGIQIRDDMMYYVSGKGLYIISMTPSGPGVPIPLYVTYLVNNLLDDLVILPDNRVAVAEIDAATVMTTVITGLPVVGINQIVIVDLGSFFLQKKIVLTSPYTVSSLAYEEGTLFEPGKTVVTSWFHGGVRQLGF